MPVTGLPAALDGALESLLRENAMTSWKIVSENCKTTIMLRFSPVTDNNNMATCLSVTASPKSTHYRRKPPSQLKRDKQRAAMRKQNSEQEVSESVQNERTLFVSSPSMYENSASVGLPDQPCDVATDARASRREFPNVDAETFALSSQLTDQCDPDMKRANDTMSLRPTEQLTATNTQVTNVVRDYVGGIKDKAVLRNIKDSARNVSFSRVVRDSTNKLICESEDFVIVVSNDYAEPECCYWLIKQRPSCQLREESDILARLTRGRPVDRGKFQPQLRVAHHTMQTIRGVAVACLA
jgi:hypothetical protein